ncbi:MAG TPA: RNA polymerase sigma factor, partial [Cytophagales bacterium]|nr:RNA polymerase sigma factor [Cytophagales bacterium]
MNVVEFNNHLGQASKSLKPFAMRLTRNLDEANDLIQDTLMKAFMNKDKFANGTNLKAWLYTIMKNTFITNYQRMIRKNTFIDTTDNLYHINSSEYVAENKALSDFAQRDINNAITRLDEVYRIPFMMYFNGYKYEEISEKLQVPLGTIKNR